MYDLKFYDYTYNTFIMYGEFIAYLHPFKVICRRLERDGIVTFDSKIGGGYRYIINENK